MASHRRTYQHDAVSSAVDPNTTIDEERLSGAGEEDDNNFSSIAQLSKQLLEKANTDDEYKYRNNDTHHQDKDDADNASSKTCCEVLQALGHCIGQGIRFTFYSKEGLQLGGLIVLLIIMGMANNLGASLMSYAMPAYPSFLLYGTTALYTVLFGIVSACVDGNPFSSVNLTWSRQKEYLILGSLTAGNGLLFQFAAAWVDGATSQVLANARIIQVPLFARCILKQRHSCKEYLGLFIVLGGIIIGFIPILPQMGNTQSGAPTEQADAWYWILSFLFSTTFSAVERVWQDRAFHDTGRASQPIKEAVCLFWYNLYSLVWYVLAILCEAAPYLNGTNEEMSFREAFRNQGDAFRCFAQEQPQHTDGKDCRDGALLWPIVFVVGYCGMFYANAVLIMRYGVLYAALVSSTVQLTSTLAFSWNDLVGDANTVAFSVYPIIGCVCVFIGVAIKGLPGRLDEQQAEVELESNIEHTGSKAEQVLGPYSPLEESVSV
eukprot:gb/GECG01003901.1/.p1 GENE.gb/GECG01003901.1/~~gb/GECG01003901.1/.p1  ORF type:complete len:491 (+),score=51.38 gb/GECG01003901.1/:1-1473(+)